MIVSLFTVWFTRPQGERISGSFFIGALIGAYIRELFRIEIKTRFYNYIWLLAFILGFTVLGVIL
jgi:hypothetical protein